MWGEIEPPAKQSPPSASCTPTPACRPEPDPEPRPEPDPQPRPEASPSDTGPTEKNQMLDDQGDNSSVRTMVEVVVLSGSPVKSQQMGEAELTLEQRRVELLQQYRSRPLVFLERYQAHLRPQHLGAFAHLSSDPRAQHYCREVLRRAASHNNRTRIRNQRYAALRALQRDGQYFSEEQMRVREPLLYEQYIGQYLSDEEVLERSQEAMQGGAGGPGGGAGGLADLLLNSYQEKLIQSRLQEEQDWEDGAQEEDEEDGGVRLRDSEWEPSPEEKALLREEFISQMHQRFLDGKDRDFNYSEVDENPDYDNLDIVSRDAEEKYFDGDEDDDDEEEEEEEGEGNEGNEDMKEEEEMTQ